MPGGGGGQSQQNYYLALCARCTEMARSSRTQQLHFENTEALVQSHFVVVVAIASWPTPSSRQHSVLEQSCSTVLGGIQCNILSELFMPSFSLRLLSQWLAVCSLQFVKLLGLPKAGPFTTFLWHFRPFLQGAQTAPHPFLAHTLFPPTPWTCPEMWSGRSWAPFFLLVILLLRLKKLRIILVARLCLHVLLQRNVWRPGFS